MTPLRQSAFGGIAALELNGKSPSTVESYVCEVYLVSKFYGKRPDLVSEEELICYIQKSGTIAPQPLGAFLFPRKGSQLEVRLHFSPSTKKLASKLKNT